MHQGSVAKWKLGSMAVLLGGLLLGGCGGVQEQPITPDEAARQDALTQQGIQNAPPSEADRQNALTGGAATSGR